MAREDGVIVIKRIYSTHDHRPQIKRRYHHSKKAKKEFWENPFELKTTGKRRRK